jgi:hypothetical protein
MGLVNPKIGSVSNRHGGGFSFSWRGFLPVERIARSRLPQILGTGPLVSPYSGDVHGAGGIVLVVLVLGYRMDRKARLRGNSVRGAGQIWSSIRQTRNDVRGSDRIRQLRPDRKQR